jgi:hypothetical protein
MTNADPPATDERVLGTAVRTVIVASLVLRVVVVAVLIARSESVKDDGLLRYDRVAASPVTPYRNFAVEWMPIQTAVVQVIAGGTTTVAGVAITALVADMAVAAALAWGWGRRTADVYLLLGLPLLSAAYTRLDLLAVAFAAWAFALARRGRDGPSGVALGLGALSGLWAAFLLPWAVLLRRRPTLVGAAACLAAGGTSWYLVGGPKAPMQVLSYRGATGWDVQSTIGGALRMFTDGATFLEGGIERIGFAPAWARTAVLLAILAAAGLAWLSWRPRLDDPAGRTALAVTASILALTPTYPAAWTSILVPWAALSWDEDRPLATGAVAAIALTGMLMALDPAGESTAVSTSIVVARQIVLLLVTAGALAPRRVTTQPDAASERTSTSFEPSPGNGPAR